MRIPFTHPSLSDLSAFQAKELPPSSSRDIGLHLQHCARCQDSLRFVHRVNVPSSAPLPLAADDLLVRIQQSRAAGARSILPGALTATPRPARRPVWAIAAAVLVVAGVTQLFTASDAEAAIEGGVLTLSPAAPRPGAVVHARYVPAAGAMSAAPLLRLRARIRTPEDESYRVPAAHLLEVGALSRAPNGVYEGRFTVPDSVVFAVLAVESIDSSRVDDNDGQGWELLVSAPDGRPQFAALMQRAEDMMGRSWEEGYASVRRATELYPDSVSGWTSRWFFESQLFSGAEAESIAVVRAITTDRLVAQIKHAPALSYHDIGSVYYRAYVNGSRPGATAADSVERQYWWARMTAEYPTHEQRAQHFAVFLDTKALGSAAALDSLERLYAVFAPLRGGAGRNLVYQGEAVARRLGNAMRLRTWTARYLSGEADSARQMAVFLSATPAFRAEGMEALRRLLREERVARMVVRPLGRNATAQERHVADARRSVLAALGQALVATGNMPEALDTLRLASDGGWEPELFRTLARSYRQAGDSAGALAMEARLVADGRTSDKLRDSLSRSGEQRAGTARWAGLVRDARQEMHARLLDRSISRVIAPGASVQSRNGAEQTLASLAGEKAALVIFWSRRCGPAIKALPALRTLIASRGVSGTPVVFVVDEAPSAALDAFLAEQKISWPVYYDPRTRLGNAMRNFGTPHYYVLDGGGRIRFKGAGPDGVQDLYGQLDAVSAEMNGDQ